MATKQKYYEYDFVDPLPEECPCPVCLEVQVDPHQVTCCGKIFCKSCLDKLINEGQKCPICRSSFFEDHQQFRDLNTERKIKQLRVRCKNIEKGCEWVGNLKDMKEFHILECPVDFVPCTNTKGKKKWMKCGVVVPRRELYKHMTELCEWRRVECTHCKFKGSHRFITGDHTKVCLESLIPCSNDGCEIKVNRSVLTKHQASCPKQIVSCRYSSVGCKARITRENIVYHNQECMEQHLDSAVDIVEKALKRIDILEGKAWERAREEYHELHWDDCRDCGGSHASYDYCPDRDYYDDNDFDCSDYDDYY